MMKLDEITILGAGDIAERVGIYLGAGSWENRLPAFQERVFASFNDRTLSAWSTWKESIDMGSIFDETPKAIKTRIDAINSGLAESRSVINAELEIAARRMLALKCLEAVQGYKDWKPPVFNRQWLCKVTDTHPRTETWTISNAAYLGEVTVTQYSNSFVVEQYVSCALVNHKVESAKRGFRKREKAEQHVEQLRSRLQKTYFAEDWPAIPPDVQEYFMIAGRLLPGYRVKGDA